MEKLAREKIATQQRLAELKNDLSQCMDIVEIERIVRQTVQPEDDQASTSTASGTASLRVPRNIVTIAVSRWFRSWEPSSVSFIRLFSKDVRKCFGRSLHIPATETATNVLATPMFLVLACSACW